MTRETTEAIKVSDGLMTSDVRVVCALCGAKVYAVELCDECKAYVAIWKDAEVTA